MTVREYIGARYVPLYVGVWDNTVAYEPLSIVQYQGSSYTSRQAVPIGIDISNETYWICSANYNAQVEAYRQEVLAFDGRIDSLEDAMPISQFSSASTVKDLIDNNRNHWNTGKLINVLCPPDVEDVPLVADYANASDPFTDNGVLLQALIDKYGRNTTFYFPIGNYGFETPVTVSDHYVTFQGVNARATQLFYKPSAASTFITFEIDTAHSIEDNMVENLSFFNVDTSMDNICFSITNPTRTCFFHIFTFGFQQHYVFDTYINTGSGIIIYNSLCHHWGRSTQFYCIRFNEKTAGASLSDIFIDNCYASLHKVGIWVYGVARDIWITNSESREGVWGVSLTAQTGVATAGGVRIINTVFDDYEGSAIYLINFSKEVHIIDCWGDTQYSNATIPTYHYGIMLRNISGAIVSGNHWGITQDTLSADWYHDQFIRIEGNSHKIVVTDNVIYTPATAVNITTYNSNDPGEIIIANNIIHNNNIVGLGPNSAAINVAYGKNILINDNIIDANVANNTTTLNVNGKGNYYKTTINSPLLAADNYLLT